MSKQHVDRYVIVRDRNVVRVDFQRDPDPPAFPGAGALRIKLSQLLNTVPTTLIKAGGASPYPRVANG